MGKDIRQIATKLQTTNVFDLVGATLHAKGITSKEFYDAMKKADTLSSPFGNNVLNAIQNSERKADELTLKVALELVEELSQIIKNYEPNQ